MLKIAIIGLGGISDAHISAWRKVENAEIKAVCDVRQEKRDKVKEARFYTDYNELLETEKLDVVDICLPTFLHVPVALQAMEAGAHVLCEKPVSLDANDVTLLYEKAKEKSVCFMVAQCIRFWPEYCMLKEVYEKNIYGKVLSGYMFRIGPIPSNSWHNWMHEHTKSGLVPIDLHIHDLDFLEYLFGDPITVDPHRATTPYQDYLSVVYQYEDFFVTAESAWYAGNYPFSAGFRFQFEKAVVAYEHGELISYEASGSVRKLNTGSALKLQDIEIPLIDGYTGEILYFADCVQSGQSPNVVKPEELISVLNILEKE